METNHKIFQSFTGKAFECDCKVRWLAEWAQAYSLQITSRERNPQFCAKPAHLRAKQPFTHVDLNDFVCPPGTSEASALVPSSIPTTSTSTTTKSPKSHSHHHSLLPEVHYEPSAEVVVQSTNTTTKQPSIITSSTKPTVVYRPSSSPPSPSSPATSYVQVVTVDEPEESEQESAEQGKNKADTSSSTTTTTTTTITSTSTLASSSKAPKVVNQKISSSSSKAETNAEQPMIKTNNNKSRHKVPQSSSSNIITQQQQSSTITPTTTTTTSQLRLLEATYRNNSISLRWEHPGGPRRDSSNLGGYQVLYRYFGSKEYHRSEGVIPATATSYTLPEYIAPNELIVICVVSLDEVHSANLMESSNSNTDSSIPIAQCREINTKDQPSSPPPIIKKGSSGVRPSLTTGSTSSTTSATSFSSLYPSLKRLNDLDKLVIAVSAAVCLFIVLAVLIFSCCFYRSVSKDHVRRQPSLRAVLAATNAAHCPLSVTSKSLSPMTKSSSLGGHGGNGGGNDWEDAVSVYSTRSAIPRARIASASMPPHLRMPPPPPPVPPPVITGTIRSHISAHQNQNGGGHPIRSTYFGSTLPNSAKVRNGGAGGSSWVLNHDPLNTTAFYPANPAAVSYGTTVTANGGGGPYSFDNAYLRNSSSLGRELLSPPPPIEASVYHQPQPNSYRSGRYQGNNSSSSSSNTAAAAVHNSRSNHRSRKSTSKGRSSKNGSHHHHHHTQPPMVTLPELRIHNHHHQNASAGVNSGSYNRLLLSSSSNSFQSANTTEYYDDSDHWNSNSGGGGSNNNGYGRSLGNGTATTNSRMNDNEVDIYVDQNYARRFI